MRRSLLSLAWLLVLAWQPQRIVSMSPTATEMLFAIGANRQVAAVDSNSNYPQAAMASRLGSKADSCG